MEIKEYIRARMITVHSELLALDEKGQELEKTNREISDKIKDPTSKDSFITDLKKARLHYSEFTIAQRNFETLVGVLVELVSIFKILNPEDVSDAEKDAIAFENKVKSMVKPFYVIENGVVTGRDMELYKLMEEYLEKDFANNKEQDEAFFNEIRNKSK